MSRVLYLLLPFLLVRGTIKVNLSLLLSRLTTEVMSVNGVI
jgi:hypothetical protein